MQPLEKKYHQRNFICKNACLCKLTSSVIRQKGESENGGNKKTNHAKFFHLRIEKETNISVLGMF